MATLVLDAAFGLKTAIIDNGMLVIENTSDEQASDKYMQLIALMLDSSNYSIDDINQMLINIGPGSFTGLRVALAVAKGLGFRSNIKYLTFTSFDYVDSKKAILLPGFSKFVYLKSKNYSDCVAIDSLDINKEYATVSLQLKEKLVELGYNVTIEKTQNYADILKKCAKNAQISCLEPLYLRKSQAEYQRENKLKNNGNI